MSALMWWALIALYVIGYVVAAVIMFRIFAADPVTGVHTADSPGERIGLIVFGGFVAFFFGLFWPLVAIILLVYRFAVAPKRGGDR